MLFLVVFFLIPSRAAAADSPDPGALLYSRTCAVCHVPAGEGYKADNAPALANPGFLSTVSDSFLRRVITEGRSGTTMSAWGSGLGGPLSPQEVEQVIAYLRSWAPLDSNRKKTSPDSEKFPQGSSLRGLSLYAARCAKCHGPSGIEGPYVRIGNPSLLADAGDSFLRRAIGDGRSKTPMPGFKTSLGEAGIEDLLALLRVWQSSNSVAAPPPLPAPLPLGPPLLNAAGPEPSGFLAYPRITSADVIHRELARGAKMALLDARAPSDYVQEHITGAVSVPFYDPNPFLAALPKDAWLACYCACPHAESGQLAQKLLAAGFAKVTVIDQGFLYWKSRNYGTRSGRDP